MPIDGIVRASMCAALTGPMTSDPPIMCRKDRRRFSRSALAMDSIHPGERYEIHPDDLKFPARADIDAGLIHEGFTPPNLALLSGATRTATAAGHLEWPAPAPRAAVQPGRFS